MMLEFFWLCTNYLISERIKPHLTYAVFNGVVSILHFAEVDGMQRGCLIR